MIKASFLKTINMSITASVVILAVLAIRWLFRKQPKIYSYILWSIVLFRLLCPYSISLNTSLFNALPQASVNDGQIEYTIPETLYPQAENNAVDIQPEDTTVNDTVISRQLQQNIVTENHTAPENNIIVNAEKHSIDYVEILSVLWICGGIYLALNNLLSLHEIKSLLKYSTHSADNIYVNDIIPTAFITGIFRPKIYLPGNLDSEQQKYILLHEQTHIRRKDYIFKLMAFAALCIHWFNPLVWLAYRLGESDMEMSCDEAVIKNMTIACKKKYSHTLISASCNGYNILQPAFNNNDTKGRIMNILNYKKPNVFISVVLVLIFAVSIVSFAANPVEATSGNETVSETNNIEETNVSNEENIFFVKPDESDYVIGKTAMDIYLKHNYPDGNYVIVHNAVTYSADDSHTLFKTDGFTEDYDYVTTFNYIYDNTGYSKFLFIKKIENGNFEIIHIDSADNFESTATEIEEFPHKELAGSIKWPIASGLVSRGFSGQYPAHTGIDIAAETGTEILAAADGTVIKAYYTDVGNGVYCVIDHGEFQTLYAHCSELNVEMGQEVRQGDVIAYVGNTGNSTGPHLHFEVKNGDERYNPYNWF